MRVRSPKRMKRRARLTARWRAWATVRCSAWVTASALELVAEPADGHDVAGVGGVGLDLRAQAADVDVHEPAVAEVVVAPHPLEQLLAAEHATGCGRELAQQ